MVFCLRVLKQNTGHCRVFQGMARAKPMIYSGSQAKIKLITNFIAKSVLIEKYEEILSKILGHLKWIRGYRNMAIADELIRWQEKDA